MTVNEHWPRPRLWLVRIQFLVERLIPIPLLVSLILFALPVTILGVVVIQVTGVAIFTRGVAFAILWLSLGPLLLTPAYRTIADFFDDNRGSFLLDDREIDNLRGELLEDLGSPKYLFISIPLTVVCIAILLNSLYVSSPLSVRLWSALTFSMLFFLLAWGFGELHALIISSTR